VIAKTVGVNPSDRKKGTWVSVLPRQDSRFPSEDPTLTKPASILVGAVGIEPTTSTVGRWTRAVFGRCEPLQIVPLFSRKTRFDQHLRLECDTMEREATGGGTFGSVLPRCSPRDLGFL